MPALYDRKTHNFWLQTPPNWTSITKDILKLHLIEHGFSGQPGSAIKKASPTKCIITELSRADQEINRIIRDEQIDFCCDVAGWPAGVHNMYGKRVLVNESPQLLVPKEGDWSFYEAVLRAVSRDYPIQYDVLMSWLKLGLLKIYRFEYRYSQVLIMVGDVSSGKSLVHLMITVLCGGTMANPLEWMMGEKFNRDLVESEHLCMEEPSVLPKDYQKYANKFKELSVVEGKRCRGLYAESVVLCPFQLVSASTNTESENTLVIPEIVRGVEDKMHTCYFPSGAVPPPGYENFSQVQIKELVIQQAPAFLHYLFNHYQVPEKLLKRVNLPPRDCQRFGMDPYHNPVVVDLVSERSFETRFLCLYERLSVKSGTNPFLGTVSKMAEWFVEHTTDPFALRLARNPDKLGYLLRSLSKKFPARVKRFKETNKGVVWMLVSEPNEEN